MWVKIQYIDFFLETILASTFLNIHIVLFLSCVSSSLVDHSIWQLWNDFTFQGLFLFSSLFLFLLSGTFVMLYIWLSFLITLHTIFHLYLFTLSEQTGKSCLSFISDFEFLNFWLFGFQELICTLLACIVSCSSNHWLWYLWMLFSLFIVGF